MIPSPLSTTEPGIDAQPKENQYTPFPVMSEMIQYDYSALQWIPSQECEQINRDSEHLSLVTKRVNTSKYRQEQRVVDGTETTDKEIKGCN